MKCPCHLCNQHRTHFKGIHDLIFVLNVFNEVRLFISEGTISQIFGPRYL